MSYEIFWITAESAPAGRGGSTCCRMATNRHSVPRLDLDRAISPGPSPPTETGTGGTFGGLIRPDLSEQWPATYQQLERPRRAPAHVLNLQRLHRLLCFRPRQSHRIRSTVVMPAHMIRMARPRRKKMIELASQTEIVQRAPFALGHGLTGKSRVTSTRARCQDSARNRGSPAKRGSMI